MATRGMMSGKYLCVRAATCAAPRTRSAAHFGLPPVCEENNFVSGTTIVNWINEALQLRLERVEDVSGGQQRRLSLAALLLIAVIRMLAHCSTVDSTECMLSVRSSPAA